MENIGQHARGGSAQPESTLERSVGMARGRKFNRGTDTRGWRSGSLDERTTMSCRGSKDSAGERLLSLGSSMLDGILLLACRYANSGEGSIRLSSQFTQRRAAGLQLQLYVLVFLYYHTTTV